MSSAAEVYAFGLTLLGLWGIYGTRKSVKLARGWSRRRQQIVLVDVLFVASCLGCSAALWTGRFQAWMAGSIGLSYVLMIPLPCSFDVVNRVRWIHAMRNFLFVAVALLLFFVATGLIPLSFLRLTVNDLEKPPLAVTKLHPPPSGCLKWAGEADSAFRPGS